MGGWVKRREEKGNDRDKRPCLTFYLIGFNPTNVQYVSPTRPLPPIFLRLLLLLVLVLLLRSSSTQTAAATERPLGAPRDPALRHLLAQQNDRRCAGGRPAGRDPGSTGCAGGRRSSRWCVVGLVFTFDITAEAVGVMSWDCACAFRSQHMAGAL